MFREANTIARVTAVQTSLEWGTDNLEQPILLSYAPEMHRFERIPLL
jgi:hypothetical protein